MISRLRFHNGLFLNVNLFIFDSAVNGLSQKRRKKRAKRNADKNSDNSEQVSADCNCGKHPYAGQTYRFAHNLGINQIAFKLLQNNNENNKPYRLHRAYKQNEERTYSRSDKRTENGNQRRDSDQNRYNRRIGHTEYKHTYEAKNADDNCFRKLT